MDKLRKSLEQKVDLKARTQEYRQWKRDFIAKKEAVMMGKTLGNIYEYIYVRLYIFYTDINLGNSAG